MRLMQMRQDLVVARDRSHLAGSTGKLVGIMAKSFGSVEAWLLRTTVSRTHDAWITVITPWSATI